MRICGLEFNQDVLHRIRLTLDGTPSVSKRSLARQVCEWNGWKAPSGRYKEAACRKALAALGGKGLVDLSHSGRTRTIGPRSKNRQRCAPVIAGVVCSLADMGRIDIEMVASCHSKSSETWKSLMDEYHYLGSGPIVGAQIWYLIHSATRGYIGARTRSSRSSLHNFLSRGRMEGPLHIGE